MYQRPKLGNVSLHKKSARARALDEQVTARSSHIRHTLGTDSGTSNMGSLIRRGGFDSAFSQPMTNSCEWLTVGGQPVADSTAQKTAREKLLVTRNGHPPDVGPPPRPVRMGSDHPEGTKDAFDHPGWTK